VRARAGTGLLRGAALAGLLAVAGCGEAPAPAPPGWPEGTVLVLDGVPVTAAEVDVHLDAVRAIRPAVSVEQLRRLVLMNDTLPRARGAVEGGERRAEALAEARGWLEAHAAGERSFDAVPPRAGNWDGVGFELWLAARRAPAGEVVGPVELPGRYAVVLVEARDDNPRAELEGFLLRVVEFPFVEEPDALAARATESRVEIVDPAWRDVVPGAYKY
jgi:hypothetical protein